MSHFLNRLRNRIPVERHRRWVFVAYDQLHQDLGPLGETPPGDLGVVLVESPWKASQRPYHQQKLALVLANQRHFALEQAERGVAVEYLVHDGPYAEALRRLPADRFPLEVMEPAEWELREDLRPLVAEGLVRVLPHTGWLTTPSDFRQSQPPSPPWQADRFYRHVRRRTGILMEAGKPVGGRFSFDGENRKRWPGSPPAPIPPRFSPDDLTREVGELIQSKYGHHPGHLDLEALPSTLADAERLWTWAKSDCLPHFGPFEDAMSVSSESLFHTRLSPLLNLHRLLPRRILAETLELDLPLPSQEGFVRQLLGWREFVRHVHHHTSGLREVPETLAKKGISGTHPLPPAYWGTPSGLACLDTVVRQVWREGWSHHITRLMVLSNLATLLGASPRELTDWFWTAYVDAYDWVVEPNVLGMGTFALGPLLTSKPYVSGSAYLDRMSDYCQSCALDPRKTCPLTRLYWAFLERHREQLEANQRLTMPLRGLARRPEEERARDQKTYQRVLGQLQAGTLVTPD